MKGMLKGNCKNGVGCELAIEYKPGEFICVPECLQWKPKGKVYSKVNMGQRISSDMYQTPYSMTEQFMEVFTIPKGGIVLEPACGEGAISKVLKSYNSFYVTEYDLKHESTQVSMEESNKNFFNETRQFEYIITNPPYRLATDFIRKCMQVCTHKFALLMPLPYLHGQKRYRELYNNTSAPFRLESVYIYTRMPMLSETIREDGKYPTGMQVYAWYVFTKSSELLWKCPKLYWIDNDAYVIRKGDRLL